MFGHWLMRKATLPSNMPTTLFCILVHRFCILPHLRWPLPRLRWGKTHLRWVFFTFAVGLNPLVVASCKAAVLKSVLWETITPSAVYRYRLAVAVLLTKWYGGLLLSKLCWYGKFKMRRIRGVYSVMSSRRVGEERSLPFCKICFHRARNIESLAFWTPLSLRNLLNLWKNKLPAFRSLQRRCNNGRWKLSITNQSLRSRWNNSMFCNSGRQAHAAISNSVGGHFFLLP